MVAANSFLLDLGKKESKHMTTLDDMLTATVLVQAPMDDTCEHASYATSTYTLRDSVVTIMNLFDSMMLLMAEMVTEMNALNASEFPPPPP